MTSNSPKVLILDNDLIHYRIPIYNILAQKFDLTHACCYPQKIEDEMLFKRITLKTYKIAGFQLQKNNLFRLCQKYDAVICQGDIHYLQYATLPMHCRRKFKIAFWGIGVSASYDKHFDANNKWDKVRDFFYKKADAQVFYTDYPIEKYVKCGYKRESLFVAPNTVEVEAFDENATRSSILFIGTLYAEKGIMHLLEAYDRAYSINHSLPYLDIIGKGPDFENVKVWINEKGLTNQITMHGAIYDRTVKAKFFEKALACISPLQAGLSVLESQGYGTTFITTKDAITGGEIFNINNGKTGILLNDVNSLSDVILDIANNPQKYVEIGKAGREHYLACRKPSDMAQGFVDAVEYMLRKR